VELAVKWRARCFAHIFASLEAPVLYLHHVAYLLASIRGAAIIRCVVSMLATQPAMMRWCRESSWSRERGKLITETGTGTGTGTGAKAS